MKKIPTLIFVIIILALVSVSCVPAGTSSEGTGHASRFICYQGGQKIIDSQTLHGVVLDRESYGGNWSIVSWTWQDELGRHYLPQEGSLCEEVR